MPGAYAKSETPPTPEWVAAQCVEFEALLQHFTAEMRRRFREKALEGRDRWHSDAHAKELYESMLAHAAGVPLAAGVEADVANFVAFLWGLRVERGGGRHG